MWNAESIDDAICEAEEVGKLGARSGRAGTTKEDYPALISGEKEFIRYCRAI
jgi:hypothetical protein